MKLTMDCQEVEDKADCHRDHYALFKVPRAVTAAELKAARKKLLLKLHPDKNRDPRAAEAFRRAQVGFAEVGSFDRVPSFSPGPFARL